MKRMIFTTQIDFEPEHYVNILKWLRANNQDTESINNIESFGFHKAHTPGKEIDFKTHVRIFDKETEKLETRKDIIKELKAQAINRFNQDTSDGGDGVHREPPSQEASDTDFACDSGGRNDLCESPTASESEQTNT